MSMAAPQQPVPGGVRWAVVLLLALHAGLALRGITGLGVTHDETAHLTAGYAYWQFNDYRLQPENGNLPQRWGALPLLALQPRLEPMEAPGLWRGSEVWLIGDHFFFGSGNPIEGMLWLARATMLFWSLALGGLVFAWARALWGNAGGLLALGMYVVSPTTLAHGPLVTSDMTAAFWLLAATGAWWRVLQDPKPGNVAMSLVATAAAFLAKFSCVLLGPVFVILAIWTWVERRHEAGSWRRLAGLTALHAVVTWAAIWIAFGLRFDPAGAGMPPVEKYYFPWEQIYTETGSFTGLIRFALAGHILPEAYLEGFAHVLYQSAGRNAFLFGSFSTTGWWWYFPATFLLKSTSAELLLTGAVVVGAMAVWRRRSPALRRCAPLLIFGAVYAGFSIVSTLNIGHRHILPLYPLLFIIGGGLMGWVQGWSRRWLAALPALSAIGCLSVAPYFLTFFNLPSGGPQTAWRKLVDSSLDWGQGLPPLADWVAEHHDPAEPLYVSYFGNDSLDYRIPEALHLAPSFERFRPRTWAPLQPGLYCVGATMMQDLFSGYRGPWSQRKEDRYRQLRAELLPALAQGELSPLIVDFGQLGTAPLWELERLRFNRLVSYLQVKRPEAQVANCFLVFRLDAAEIATVTTGTPAELANLMEQALTPPD